MLVDKEFRYSTRIFRTETKISKSSLGTDFGIGKTLVGSEVHSMAELSWDFQISLPDPGRHRWPQSFLKAVLSNLTIKETISKCEERGWAPGLRVPQVDADARPPLCSWSQTGPPWGAHDIHLFLFSALPGSQCPLIKKQGARKCRPGKQEKMKALWGKATVTNWKGGGNTSSEKRGEKGCRRISKRSLCL